MFSPSEILTSQAIQSELSEKTKGKSSQILTAALITKAYNSEFILF